ncbi:hypothetical protein PTSG_07638 [Salpingoeca rosetta]|uniref:GAIN-B domain-containing protein n=1 Tax=Salpingoeca rosetta (strain ATCC 50818 / BSB-021) TaxID=946362 RepID=F2UHC2_SALR5|nr:uncharacterized protein PTSG_07638 [Salpingoeca rosetta]EGD76521.1 hypothetical protein PTSG_07638 [Salpingoeca rosetta]|eukprot:XP_004991435.1 hypothetical protein PTSG_07638 [Salpingoeca rosetta]
MCLQANGQLVSFSSQEYTVLESSATALLPVSCAGPCAGVNCSFVAQGETASSDGTDFTTTSGFVLLSAAESQQLQLQLVDDDVPEPPETIGVSIHTCKNAAGQTIATDEGSVLATTVRVLDDDVDTVEAGFTISQYTAEEGQQVVLTIERDPFTTVAVDTTYSVQVISDTATAGVDVTPVTRMFDLLYRLSLPTFCEVTINATASTATVVLSVVDDSDPEMEEQFIVTLLDASPQPYVAIDQARASVQVTIPSNDDVSGVFRFADASLAQDAEEPEGAQTQTDVPFTVTRSAGTLGAVDVSWRIKEAAAAASDFAATSGTVSFQDGQTAAAIVLTIVPDSVAEQPETYTLELFDATAGRLASSKTKATLTIAPSDYTNGLLVVDTSSPYVAEEVPDQDTFITITVLRQSGTQGVVGALLTVLGGSADFATVNAPVFFQDGQASTTVTLVVRDDDIPELDESFELKLQSPTGGAVIDRVLDPASVTILASDDPYGTFSFDLDTATPITVIEGPQPARPTIVNLPIARSGGTFGDITITYNATGAHRTDIEPAMGSVLVPAGTCCVNITLQVTPDTMQEPAEMITVSLTGISSGGEGDASLAPAGQSITLIIAANDDTVSFVGDVATSAREGDVLTFTVVRSGQAAGPASVDVHVLGAALTNATTLSFTSSARVRQLQLTIEDDTTPEASESVTIALTNPTGDIVVPSPNITIRVAPSDGGAGVVAFTSSSKSVRAREPTSATTDAFLVALNVSRTPPNPPPAQPVLADASVSWALTAVDGSVDAEVQFEQTSGSLQWVDGESTATIWLRVRNDMTPELAQAFVVSLSNPSDGVVLESDPTADVVVGASDRPHGLFLLSNASVGMQVTGASMRVLTFTVVRTFGTIGDVRVSFDATYRLENGTVPPQDSVFLDTTTSLATSGGNTSSTNSSGLTTTTAAPMMPDPNMSSDEGVEVRNHTGSVTLLHGQDAITVHVRINPDAPLCATSTIEVSLEAVQVVGDYADAASAQELPPALGNPSSLTFTLPFEAVFGFVSFAQSSLEVDVVEPQGGVANATFLLERTSGSYSTMHIAWQITPVGGTGNASDVVATQGVAVMPAGKTSAFLRVGVVADAIPEFGEQFEVDLVDVTQGVGSLATPTSATLTVLANDDPSGVFQWDAASRGPLQAEEGSSIALTIERLGGALDAVTVTVSLQPAELNDVDVVITRVVPFPRGVRSRLVALQVLQDTRPELQTQLTATLQGVSGGARLGDHTQATVIVPENDDPRGVFSFAPANDTYQLGNYTVAVMTGSEPPAAAGDSATTRVSFPIQREAGAFEAVDVPFRVMQCASALERESCVVTGVGEPADADVSPTLGSVAFEEDQRTGMLVLDVLADDIPEEDEFFLIELLPPSNARLQGNLTRAVLVVLANDDAIRMQNETLRVSEDDGFVNITVLRSGLLRDQANLRFSIIEVDARPNVASGFVEPANTILTFSPDDEIARISIQLVADDAPQPDRAFEVQLSRADDSGDFVIVQGRTVVTIAANDDAAGVFTLFDPFPAEIQENTEEETLFAVRRSAGRFGSVRVPWQVVNVSNCLEQLRPTEGSVVFSASQSFVSFSVNAVDDDVPEVAQSCAVTLLEPESLDTDIGEGRISGEPTSVTIAPNDDYAGVYAFPDDLTNVTAREEQGIFRIPVERGVAQLVSGTVSWSINPAIEDVATASGVLVFLPHVVEQDIVIVLRDDNITEYPKPFTVTISNASPGRLGNRTSLDVLLLSSEQPWGYFAMADAEVHVREVDTRDAVYSIPVVRQRGTDGTVHVSWAVTACVRCLDPNDTPDDDDSACEACSDAEEAGITPQSGTLTFGPEVEMRNITITVLSDTLPEPTQQFTVTLTDVSVPSLSAIEARASTSALVVEENDAPFGLFSVGFASANATGISSSTRVQETRGATVSAVITRDAGVYDTVWVDWRITAVSPLFTVAGDSSDVYNTTGRVVFAPGERSQQLDILIRDDDIPELDEVFAITLVDASRGAVLDPTASTAHVTIAENDDPYGVVAVAPESQVLVVSESDGSVRVPLVRTRGLFGNVTASWEVPNPSTVQSDIAPLSGTVSFREGADSAVVPITVFADALPEVAESFVVQVTAASDGAVLAPQPTQLQALVVIRASNDPHGTFVFGALSYTFPEPGVDTSEEGGEGSALSHPRHATVYVRRLGGLIGTVAVSVRTFVLSTGSQFASTLDFEAFSNKTLIFAAGEEQRPLNITLTPDDLPELSERFAVQLTGARLLSSDAGPYSATSPRLGEVQQTTISIAENDDARGVFAIGGVDMETGVLASLQEGSLFTVVVQRNRGTFGAVDVSLALSPMGCTVLSCAVAGEDFAEVVGASDSGVRVNITGGTMAVDMAFAEGDTQKRLVLRIADDTVPEIDELVRVQIQSVSRGRIFAAARTAELVLEENDDARGVFAFANTTTVAVTEPEDAPLVVSWTVERLAGTFGDVSVQWMVSGPDGFADSINATTGELVFVPGQISAQLVLSVLPDTVPEVTQDLTVTLLPESVQGGARVMAVSGERQLMILANDDPFGVFSLPVSVWVSEEPTAEMATKAVPVTMSRSGGAYGKVRVTYTVRATTPSLLAQAQLAFPFNHVPRIVASELFETAQSGANFDIMQTLSGIETALACQAACLAVDACASVSFSSTTAECLLSATRVDSPILFPRYEYYERRANASIADRYLATAGADFVAAYRHNVTLEEGQTEAVINVTVLADDVPEMWEHFQVAIDDVELLGPYPPPTHIASPRVTEQTQELGSHVVVAANDDPFGRFVISPTLSTSAVLEEDNATISLVIARQGGAFEDVIVDWTTALTAATAGDLTPTEGQVAFAEGERLNAVTVRVLNDDEPELDETVPFSLTAATNTAAFSSAPFDVVILGNDDASGRFGISSGYTSVSGEEGTTVTVLIVRTFMFQGPVRVGWSVEGVSESAVAAMDVAPVSGDVSFLDGQTTGQVQITIVDDAVPELAEQFRVRLDNVSVPSASLRQNVLESTLTIPANDDAYGVVGWAEASQAVLVNENTGEFSLSISRTGGLFVALSVRVRTRATNTTTPTSSPATADDDYLSIDTTVVIGAGESAVTVPIRVYDDATPELSETFEVQLVSVEPTSVETPPLPNTPRVSMAADIAVITINANDDAAGVFSFTSSKLSVEEGKPANVTIVRTGGTLGETSMSLLFQDGFGAQGARRGEDYVILTSRVTFMDGQTEAVVPFRIVDDTRPELAETFFIQLTGLTGGRYGLPNAVTVTIAASDDASGVLRIGSATSVTVNEGDTTPRNTTVDLLRGPGVFGVVDVSVSIQQRLADGSLVPVQDDLVWPDAVSFTTGSGIASFVVDIVPDTTPELTEEFIVRVTTDDARLGSPLQATIIVPENDDAHGRFSLSSASPLTIDEDNGPRTVRVDVVREGGTFGQQTVTWQLSSDTATLTKQDGVEASSVPTLVVADTLAVAGSRAQVLLAPPVDNKAVSTSPVAPSGEGADLTLLVASRKNTDDGSGDGDETHTFMALRGLGTPLVVAEVDMALVTAIGAGWVRTQDGSPDVVVACMASSIEHTRVHVYTPLAESSTFVAVATIPSYDTSCAVLDSGHVVACDTTSCRLFTVSVRALASPTATVRVTSTLTLGARASLLHVVRNTTLGRAAGDSDLLAVAEDGAGRPTRLVFVRVDAAANTLALSGTEVSVSHGVSRIDATGGDVLVVHGTASQQGGPGNSSTVAVQVNGDGVESIAVTLLRQAEATAATSPAYFYTTDGGVWDAEAEAAGDDAVVRIRAVSVDGNSDDNDRVVASAIVPGLGAALAGAAAADIAPALAWYTGTSSFVVAIVAPDGAVAETQLLHFAFADGSLDVARSAGDVVFLPSQATHALFFTALQDDIPELLEELTLDIGGDVVFGSQTSVSVTIAASDTPRGELAFASASLNSVVSEAAEPQQQLLTVVREFGAIGAVSVAWRVLRLHDNGTTAQAAGDMQPLSGTLTFADGVDEQTFAVSVLPDTAPEPTEWFVVELYNATGGASLHTTRHQASITVPANDGIHGVFTLQVNGNGADDITVEEGAQDVIVQIQRTVGSLGRVQVDLLFLSAASGASAVFGEDVVNDTATSGLVFADGQTTAQVLLRIPDDDIPEGEERLRLRLGSPVLVQAPPFPDPSSPRTDGRDVTLVIPANDDASGIVSVRANSTALVREGAGRAYVVVERTKGTFGAVTVSFELRGTGANPAVLGADFSSPLTQLVLEDGVASALVPIDIVDDTSAEEPETFILTVTGVSGGVANSPPLLDAQAASVKLTIDANDGVSGLFSLADTTPTSINLTEGGAFVLAVQRTGGFYSDVDIAWTIVGPAAGEQFAPGFSGVLTFPAGRVDLATQMVTITLLNDTLPEPDEVYELVLATTAPGAALAPEASPIHVRALASDASNGVFGFAGALARVVPEPTSGVTSLPLTVERTAGTTGTVQLRWAVDDVCDVDAATGMPIASPNASCVREHPRSADFGFGDATPALRGRLTFLPGEHTHAIPDLFIVNDNDAEGRETFRVTLTLLTPIDGRLAADRASVWFTIPPNDDGEGVFSIAPASRQLSVQEGTTMPVTITRALGDFGAARVSFRVARTTASTGPLTGDLSVSPAAGVVTIADGESSATVDITALRDGDPEFDEAFTLTLTNTSLGRLQPQTVVATVTVPANDAPYGTFRLTAAEVAVVEPGFTRALQLQVTRTNGTAGTVACGVRVSFELGPDSRASASKTQALGGLCETENCTLLFAPGSQVEALQIALPTDVLLEAGDLFHVTLASATLQDGSDGGEVAAGTDVVPVVAQDQRTRTAVVGEAEANNVIRVSPASVTALEGALVTFNVSRGSTRGILSADWAFVSGSGGGNPTSDLSQASGRLVTADAVGVIAVRVTDDTSPEPLESFSLQLSNIAVEGDDQVDVRSSSAVLSVPENDDPRGVFSLGQLSATVASEGESVTLPVVRSRGRVGTVRVVFSVNDAGEQVEVNAAESPDGGGAGGAGVRLYAVDFQPNQGQAEITFTVSQDMEAELASTVAVQLVSAEPLADDGVVVPPTADTATARVFSVLPSDDPHGVFSIREAGSDLRVTEESGAVSLTIVRGGGSIGTVDVEWVIPDAGAQGVIASDLDLAGFAPDATPEQAVDINVLSGTIRFEPAETERVITVFILNDDLPEPDEPFTVALQAVTLRDDGNGSGGASTTTASPDAAVAAPRISNTRGSVTVVILANDNPNGMVTFSQQRITAQEGGAHVARLTLLRQGARYGPATVRWEASVDTTLANNGFSLQDDLRNGVYAGNVTVPAEASSAVLEIGLAADGIPEEDEAFVVLLSQPSSGALLGALTQATVTVAANDNPSGTVGFPCYDQYGAANADGTGADEVVLSVRRQGGTIGSGSVTVETMDGTADASLYQRISQVLVFTEGQRVANVTLQTFPLPSGTGSRTVVLRLRDPQGMLLDEEASTSTVTIYASKSRARLLAALQTAACNPSSTDEEVLAQLTPDTPTTGKSSTTGSDGSGAVDNAQLQVIVAALQDLIPGSAGADAATRSLIDSLFAITLTPGLFGTDIATFEPLPELLEAYARELLLGRAADGLCPGMAEVSLPVVQTSPDVAADEAVRVLLLAQPTYSGFTLNLGSNGDGNAGPVEVMFPDQFESTDSNGADSSNGTATAAGLLQNTVLSITLPETTVDALVNPANPLVYRVPTLEQQGDAGVTDAHIAGYVCVWWDAGLSDGAGAWTSEGCATVSPEGSDGSGGGARHDATAFVECRCTHATAFAVLVAEDVAESLPPVSNAAFIFMIVAFTVVVVAQGVCGYDMLPATKVQLHMFASVVVACVLLLVSSLVSDSLDADSCATLGVFVHAMVLACLCTCVYASMHAHKVVTTGEETYGRGLAACWALASVVIVVYIAVHRGALVDSFSGNTYGPVRNTLDFCAIPRVTAGAWAATVLPFVVAAALAPLLARRALLPSEEEWGRHQDLFSGRSNAGELSVRAGLGVLLLLFWAATAVALLVDAGVGKWLQLGTAILCCMHVLFFYIAQKPRSGGSAITTTTTARAGARGVPGDLSYGLASKSHVGGGGAGGGGGRGRRTGGGGGGMFDDLDVTATSIPMSTFVDEPASPPQRAYDVELEPSLAMMGSRRLGGAGAGAGQQARMQGRTAVEYPDSLAAVDAETKLGRSGEDDDDIFSESYDDLIQALQVASMHPRPQQQQQQQQGESLPYGYASQEAYDAYAPPLDGGRGGRGQGALAAHGATGPPPPPPPQGFEQGYVPSTFAGIGGDVMFGRGSATNSLSSEVGGEGVVVLGGGDARLDINPSPMSNSEIRRQSIADTHL